MTRSEMKIRHTLIGGGHETVFVFMEKVIDHLCHVGKFRTSETYAATLRSFRRFRDDRDLEWCDMDTELLVAYEAYLRDTGICPNTSSFYLRNLRAVYHRAEEKGLVFHQDPFRHVYTGVDKTVKRGISLKLVKRIKELDLSSVPSLDFARDMFLFSFYTRGMSFVDMAYLKKKDLQYGILSYRRHKTGQLLLVKWEKCMQTLVDKYDTGSSVYLLPIIKSPEGDTRTQYQTAAHKVNRLLKKIGKRLGVPIPLTMYVSRHSWASIAKSKNVPLSVISEGMGHDSENTTRIYLASLDNVAIDKANGMILKSL